MLAASHSRLPVYEETIDHIIGILHIRDLFALELKGQEALTQFDIVYAPLTSLLHLRGDADQRTSSPIPMTKDAHGHGHG